MFGVVIWFYKITPSHPPEEGLRIDTTHVHNSFVSKVFPILLW